MWKKNKQKINMGKEKSRFPFQTPLNGYSRYQTGWFEHVKKYNLMGYLSSAVSHVYLQRTTTPKKNR